MKLNFKKVFQGFLIVFPIAFIVTVITTMVYNLIAHGYGEPDWDTSIKFALALGFSLPLINQKK